jgi:hypothetical protein
VTAITHEHRRDWLRRAVGAVGGTHLGGSVFDLAGRVVKNVPAPINLEIPDYRFTAASTLQIG